MQDEYDFNTAQRATGIEHLNRLRAGKTRITIMLDSDLLDAFRTRATALGMGYQTLINQALRQALDRQPVDEDTLRRVLREELTRAA